MISRHLQLDDLQGINDPTSVAVLFEQLGYAVCCDPIAVEDLELPPASANSIREVYLLANQGDGDLQIFFLELHPHCWSSDVAAANRMYNIAKSLCQRPSLFLLVATCHYKKLLLVSPIKTFDKGMELRIKIAKAFIDLKDPSFYELNLLEKMATRSLDLRSLYQVQHQTLAKARRVEKPGQDNDSVRWYLNQIGKIPLLTGHEEVCLSHKIQYWLSLEESKKRLESQLKREVTDQEWADSVSLRVAELYNALVTGKFASNRLVAANLRFVVCIAKRYIHRDIDLLDLIQEGNNGLMIAAKKFDPKKGCKFSTYAAWWIQQSIIRSIHNYSRIIRLPVHLYEKLSCIKKAKQRLTQELRRSPTLIEIATDVGITIEQMKDYDRLSISTCSLDANLTENLTLADSLADSHTLDDWLELKFIQDDVHKMLSKLNLKEQEIIRLRFGLQDNKKHSLQEIANHFGLTRERIRQIESKILKKLKSNYLSLYSNNHDNTEPKEPIHKTDMIDSALPVKNITTKEYLLSRSPKEVKVIQTSIQAYVEPTNRIYLRELVTSSLDTRINVEYKIILNDQEYIKDYVYQLVSASSYTTLDQIIYIVLKISKYRTPDLYATAETELLQLMGWQLATNSVNPSSQ